MLIEYGKLDVSLITGPAYGGEVQRSPGLHLSDIYQDIENTVAPREPMDEGQLAAYRAGGFLWEQAFSKALADSVQDQRYVRPGEFEVDGVIGSPDLIDNEKWWVVDTKVTWKSARKLESLERYFWTWLVQAKGYCRMICSQDAELWVFCVNGDYKPPAPKAIKITLHFSVREIEENWNMILNHARKRGWLR